MKMRFSVAVPTLNASSSWLAWTTSLEAQTIAPESILVLDSSSDDGTLELARSAGFRTVKINRSDFNHGATRQLALALSATAEILVYLTQDAILADRKSLERLVETFRDSNVGAAYGRQLPRMGAGRIEAHARLFNYPSGSQMRSFTDRGVFGLKTIFMSNSFAAYRRTALEKIGGFPSNVIMGEDTYVAAKMLLSEWRVAYVANATVYHSHNYSPMQEFKRYFDMGVLHTREPWMLEEFGKAAGEGRRYVLSELRYCWPKHIHLIPSVIARNALKLIGYRAGLLERYMGSSLKRKFSMHASYWTECWGAQDSPSPENRDGAKRNGAYQHD